MGMKRIQYKYTKLTHQNISSGLYCVLVKLDKPDKNIGVSYFRVGTSKKYLLVSTYGVI